MMITQTGRLLYISENAAEYLGHSMVSYHCLLWVGSFTRAQGFLINHLGFLLDFVIKIIFHSERRANTLYINYPFLLRVIRQSIAYI